MNDGAQNQVEGDIVTIYQLSLNRKCTTSMFMATASVLNTDFKSKSSILFLYCSVSDCCF